MDSLEKSKQLGIIVVAAGNSSRLGQPKQLVKFKSEPLLNHTIKLAEVFSEQFICVLGFQAVNIAEQLKINQDHFIINKHWQQGMGSSIAVGIDHLSKQKNIDAILILLCDQYLVSRTDIEDLLDRWTNSDNKIIASQYFDDKTGRFIEGAPAIFPKEYFTELKKLTIKGARDILKNNPQDLISIKIDNAAFDLDTPGDLQHLQNL